MMARRQCVFPVPASPEKKTLSRLLQARLNISICSALRGAGGSEAGATLEGPAAAPVSQPAREASCLADPTAASSEVAVQRAIRSAPKSDTVFLPTPLMASSEALLVGLFSAIICITAFEKIW